MPDFSGLYRQIKMMLGIGKVTGMKDTGPAQTLQYRNAIEVMTAARLAEFGFSSGPPVGSDVVVAFLGGDRSNPVVIATNSKAYRHTGLKSGETVIYDQWGQFIKLTEHGITVEANGQPVTVSRATVVTITGTEEVIADTPVFKCTGDIIDNSDTNNTTMKQLRDTFNNHDHFVEGVQGGGLTVQSDPPGELVK
ncbi:phage baseplate assembly protein V [Pantoea vagans]|uniref:phage baseplate assembly protein V n=1 Tax=Pantoea vagans TaxID=470934 RepID=UPI0023B177CE|nr:phage baseplate assembly protein V [Pantoea vagans]MDE8559054.1 phage baseplate assembly protein V [Pantoea vagans]